MADFQTMANLAVDELLELEPEEATQLGDHRFDDRFADRSQAGADLAVRRLRARQLELERVDLATLDKESLVDAKVLANQLALRIFSYEELREPSWNPLVYNPGDGLFSLLSQRTLPPEARLRSICGRLEAIPDLVQVGRRQLENCPEIHLRTALDQHGGVVKLIRDEVDLLIKEVNDLFIRGRVAKAQQRALVAWDAFGRHLEDSLGSAKGEFRLGPERFSEKLSLYLHSPLGAEEVLRRANARLDALTEELAEAAGQLSEGGGGSSSERIRRVLDTVAEHHSNNQTVLAEAGAVLEQLTSAVDASGLFTIPTDPYDLEVVPEFMRGTASAYCMPAGPFEEGARSKVMISPTPDDWTKEQSESFYREVNSAMMVMLMAHEAMPGHVLQLAVARAFQGPTKVRAAFYNGPFVEGWACHAERVIGELGIGGLPVRTQQLKVQMRTTINAILDAAVHAGDMSESEAVEMMTKRGFQEQAEAEGKWRRACLTSAQLSTYFVGYAELADLFEGIAPIASYDDALAHGSPPTSLLPALLS